MCRVFFIEVNYNVRDNNQNRCYVVTISTVIDKRNKNKSLLFVRLLWFSTAVFISGVRIIAQRSCFLASTVFHESIFLQDSFSS